MNIVICNSQHWFHLNDEISLNHNVLDIREKTDLSFDVLQKFQADLVFFPHWNWIVEKEIFSNFKCIAFHTAPLPYGRGGSPIQNLIQRGHTKSPVSALAMSDGIDNGPIYDQEDISLEGSLSEILKRLDSVTNILMRRLVEHLPKPKDQVGDPKIFRRLGHSDNEISFDANFEEVYNAIRMLDDPSYPCAYLTLRHILIEFSEINKVNDELFCRVRISKKNPSV